MHQPEVFVVRIQFRNGADPDIVRGIVENVGTGRSHHFGTLAELLRLLQPRSTKKRDGPPDTGTTRNR